MLAATTPVIPGNVVSKTGDRAGLVQIGAGRKLYLQCRGAGSPIVVLVSGSGVAADNWSYTGDPGSRANPAKISASAVYPEIGKYTRVCAYDRPGTEQMNGAASRSTPVRQPTTAEGDASDLQALLGAAKEPGPYVIVGHSWGGLIAIAYARQYAREVSGLVLIDPGSPYLQRALPPEVWSQWMRDIQRAGQASPGAEQPDYPASIKAFRAAPTLSQMPAVVLTSDKPFDYLGIGNARKYWTSWLKAQALLSDALRATHISKTDSGHFVENQNAELVNHEIRTVVAARR
ncbi:MAG: alpha/beta hydrolase [Candidatus Tumulicola sp.]